MGNELKPGYLIRVKNGQQFIVFLDSSIKNILNKEVLFCLDIDSFYSGTIFYGSILWKGIVYETIFPIGSFVLLTSSSLY